MISAYASVAEFVRQMKKAGSVSQFFNVSFVGSTALAEALGKDGYGVMISQVVPFPWSPLTPIVKEYLDLAKNVGQGGRQLLEPRRLHRREGAGRGPAPRRQGPYPREVHCDDGIDVELRDRRLRGPLLARQPQRLAVSSTSR